MMTLDKLIEQLTNFRARNEGSGEYVVLGAHQPSYPLQERVAGLYHVSMAYEYARLVRLEDCLNYDADICSWEGSPEGEGFGYWNEDGPLCPRCYGVEMNEQDSGSHDTPEGKILRIVLDGAPDNISPYAPGACWEEF